VVVTQHPDHQDKYLLVAGYRRYAAHKILQWDTIEAIVRDKISERDARLINLKENILRKNLNILEEAQACQHLYNLGLSETDAAKELQTSRGWVQVRFMLLSLSEEIQKEAAAGILTQTDVRELYTLRGNREAQVKYVHAVKDAKKTGGSVLKARAKQTRKPSDKRLRRRPEIFDMMDHVQESIGNGIWTRTMAWCAGEISDMELFHSIKIHAEEIGIPYAVPQSGADY